MWDLQGSSKPRRLEWRTRTFYKLSKVCSMHTLRSGVVGWGCCRLVNASKAKPAETVVFAVPPAMAVLRTRPEGDIHLTLTFHLAVMHQVRPPCQPTLVLLTVLTFGCMYTERLSDNMHITPEEDRHAPVRWPDSRGGEDARARVQGTAGCRLASQPGAAHLLLEAAPSSSRSGVCPITTDITVEETTWPAGPEEESTGSTIAAIEGTECAAVGRRLGPGAWESEKAVYKTFSTT